MSVVVYMTVERPYEPNLCVSRYPSQYCWSSYHTPRRRHSYSNRDSLLLLLLLNQSINSTMSEEDPLVKQEEVEEEEIKIAPLPQRIVEVIKLFWFLGLIAFGGPSAHVGIMRDHLVLQNKFIDDEPFMELFSLCGGLPGPTSTQLLIALAVTHAGPIGGLIAFFFWLLPAFAVLSTAGVFLYAFVSPKKPPFWLVGVPPAAVSLIFKAFYAFSKKLDQLGVAIAMISCVAAVMINGDYNIAPTSSQVVYPALLFIGGFTTIVDYQRSNPIGTYWKPNADEDQGMSVRTILYYTILRVYIFFVANHQYLFLYFTALGQGFV